MLNRKMKPIAVAVGAAFAVSVAAGAIADEADPFAAELLDGALFADAHGGEGKCGEDKAEGEGEGEAKCGEGKCGEDHGEGESEEAPETEGEDSE
jgi:uncharacterized low-complexity protein